MQNDDPYEILQDKVVHMHKQPEKVTLPQDAKDAHEKRFEKLPYNGMPVVHSKVKRLKESVDMNKSLGRQLPIHHPKSNEPQ